MLLKFALILGVEIIENITFEEICPRNLIPFNISGNSNQVGSVVVGGCCSNVAQSAGHGCESFVSETKSLVTVNSSEAVTLEGSTAGCQLKRKLCASSSSPNDPLAISAELEQKISDTNPSHDDGDSIVTRKGRNEVDGNVCSGGKKKSKNSLPLSRDHHQRRKHRYSDEDKHDEDGVSPHEEGIFDPTHRKKPSGIKSNQGVYDDVESSDETSSSSENDIKDVKVESLFKTNSDEEAIKVRERDETGNGNLNERRACSCCCHLHLNKDSHWKNSDYVGALAHFAINSKNPATASPYVDYEKILARLHSFQFDIVLGADGRRNTLSDNFPRKEFRGRLAIAITANFVNTHTLTEAQIPEISGISFIYNQQLFRCVYRGVISCITW